MTSTAVQCVCIKEFLRYLLYIFSDCELKESKPGRAGVGGSVGYNRSHSQGIRIKSEGRTGFGRRGAGGGGGGEEGVEGGLEEEIFE